MTEVKPLVRTVLSSGLVDAAQAALLEKWGSLPAGASELVCEDALKDATRETLERLAEGIACEVERVHTVRETHLDLERMKWPCEVDIKRPRNDGAMHCHARSTPALVDRMGRYFFRTQDVRVEWFVPGGLLSRRGIDEAGHPLMTKEVILEVTPLYHGDSLICVQVSTQRT